MGYGELLRVLEEEASREARDLLAAARRESERIVSEAREAARSAQEGLLARESSEIETNRRAALDSLALDRDRALLFERRRLLAELREEILRRLPDRGSPRLDRRLLEEILPEAGDGPLEVVVDPGAEGAARDAVAGIAQDAAGRTVIRAAAARRGGVELVDGRRVLDDTLPARLERAWPGLERELAEILFGEAQPERAGQGG